jgi:molecular chaperone DnaK (HSP70)
LYHAGEICQPWKFSDFLGDRCFDNKNLSCSIQQKGRVDIIANDQGHRITPSWVSFSDDERLIGDAAKNAFHSNPENTVFDAKREYISAPAFF